MKLFSFFKKRKETIDIEIDKNPLYKPNENLEQQVEQVHEPKLKEFYSLKNCNNLDEKRNLILNANQSFEKKSKELYHKYSFLKLFARSADKDNKFNETLLLIDKETNRLRKMHDDLKRKIELINYVELKDEELEHAINLINQIFSFHSELKSDLEDFQSRYYKHLKMASYSICNDKSYQELDSIYKSINKFVEDYKSFNDAYDFVFYNSGSLVVDTVTALMECINNSNNKDLKKTFSFEYFLESAFVVALSFPEWIELFTKIKYVIRISSKVELFDYLKFRDLYLELEKRYIIMLIFNEMKKT